MGAPMVQTRLDTASGGIDAGLGERRLTTIAVYLRGEA